MEKLIVKEMQIKDEEEVKKVQRWASQLKPGYKYSCFQDPITGKYYRPVEGFTVIVENGDDLSDRFIEVEEFNE